jgi:hypothetical protein
MTINGEDPPASFSLCSLHLRLQAADPQSFLKFRPPITILPRTENQQNPEIKPTVSHILDSLIPLPFPFWFLINMRQRERESGRERAGQEAEIERDERSEEERGERCFSIKIMHWVCTVFPYALGNTVETQWTKLNLGLLLWDDFVVFSLFFPK